jgi:hypothetical protein
VSGNQTSGVVRIEATPELRWIRRVTSTGYREIVLQQRWTGPDGLKWIDVPIVLDSKETLDGP